MDNSPIPNFITRKTASERCQLAERSLQRYWSRAIDHRDLTVLEHLKLRTEDGEITDGPAVTKKLIDKFKTDGKNPTWFAQAAWVEKTYGPRISPKEPEHPRDEINAGLSAKELSSTAGSEIVSILKEQLRQSQQSHQEDKRTFHQTTTMLKEMFDTLKAEHSDTKELLIEVYKVFGGVSQARLAAPQSSVAAPDQQKTSDSEPDGSRPVIEVKRDIAAEKGTADKRSTEAAPPPSTTAKRSKSPPANVRRKKSVTTSHSTTDRPSKPKWYHMPTLKRLLSRSRK